MENFISSLAENIYEHLNPSYIEKKERIKSKIESIRLESIATLIGSLALCVLGITLINSGAIGFSIILVSLPITYLSFNLYQVCGNGDEVINHPSQYITLGLSLDKKKFKRKLREGTIGFSWIVNYAFKKATLKDETRPV